MKRSLLLVGNAALCISTTSLQAKDPVLATPGTATWSSGTTSTGTKTVFTLTNNTVLKWDQLNLEKGSEIDFNFVGGKTVVNFLGGDDPHIIDGSITSNGIVAFFSPTADLEVNGSIIAKGVTLATANVDAEKFSDEDGYEMSSNGGFNFLTINGHVEATDGDVVLGGERIVVSDTGKIQASGDALVGAGRNVTVSESGENRIKETSGLGYILHTGETRASRIEIAAGQEISNQGRIDSGKGKIFLSVGENGKITNESTGIIAGDLLTNGTLVSDGKILVPDEGDSVPSVSESSLTLPELTRPDGSQVVTTVSQPENTLSSGNVIPVANTSKPTNTTATSTNKEISTLRTLSYSVPMSASSDAKRDNSRVESNRQQVAKNDSSSSLLQRSSFFGLRGGSSKKVIAKR